MGFIESLPAIFTKLLGPSLIGVFVATVIALSFPFLLHLYIYRSRGSTTLPTFLLVGPCGAGKTALITHLERGRSAATHVSQVPVAAEVSLPVGTKAASSRFRSANDPSSQQHKKFLVVDTPGHGKLRYHALDRLNAPENIKGIIFMVDASNLASQGSHTSGAQGTNPAGAQPFDSLRETVDYLHDLLLLLQKRATQTKSSKPPPAIPVLIAANKMDLFTALPVSLAKGTLEKELGKVRYYRSKGLLDSGVSMGDMGEEKEVLGDTTQEKFTFSQMREFDIFVDVRGGSVLSSGQANEGEGDIQEWWSWIGERL